MCVGVSVWMGWGNICVAEMKPETETPINIETRTHNQCGDMIEKSQAPDDEACYTDTTPTQPRQNSNTHRNKNTRPMW